MPIQPSRLLRLPLYPMLLVFFELGAYLSNDIYLPALPQISLDFETTNALAQMTLTSWFLGSASLFLILGPLSDRIGRRPIILGGICLFALSTLLCALSTSIEMLIFARFVQGMSICSIGLAGYATIHEFRRSKNGYSIYRIDGCRDVNGSCVRTISGRFVTEFDELAWSFLVF